LLLLLLLLLRVVAVVFLAHLVDEALVVLRMLQIAFGLHAVARRHRVTRERDILFVYLERIAANADIRTVAVEGLHARIGTPAASVVIVPVAAAAIIVVAATKTSSVVIVSHEFFSLRFILPQVPRLIGR